MAIPILSTKLHIPAPPSALVARPQLTARLGAAPPGTFILVSAPAGFGKTSLIAEWAHQCRPECLVSWVHLDESEGELVRFLSYLIASLQTHQGTLGEAALAGLQSLPPAPTEAVLTSLVNEIGSLERDLILILDDYHRIDDPAVHAAVGFLVEHLPQRASLVLATRTDPPLPIHRWRAQGRMVEIRTEDLRFSRMETETFLTQLLNQPFSAGEISALDRRVEGWIAGLQMLAISLHGRKDANEFIKTFSGSHRFIMDYLTEEIFNQQPSHSQNFLLRTSILDRLCGPLCDALLDEKEPEREAMPTIPAAQEILEQLERANLFLLPMDEERHWYRYHPLFANVLQQRLRQTLPEEIPGLFQRASAWHAAYGTIDEAFAYALAGSDYPAAAQLVEDHAMETLSRGATTRLYSWLTHLPEETILTRPWLSAYMGWVLLLSGKFETLDRYLLAAEEGHARVQNSKELRGHIAAIRAYATAMGGEVEQAHTLAREALDLLPHDNLNTRSVVAFIVGGINFVRRDFPGAIEAMMEASETAEQAGNLHVAVSALSSVGYLQLQQGHLAAAERTYLRALKLGTGRSGRPLPIAAGVHSGLAELHLVRNNLKAARQFAETGVDLAGQWGNMDSLVSSYLALARVSHQQGQAAEAQAALGEAKRYAAGHNLSPGTEERIKAYEALILEGKSEKIGAQLLVEPLSGRELEVLQLMAEGRSNPEIADELILAVGTVKAHTSSIYRKLDTRSRTQAVIRARELGLLR